jgi:hypothetical protein
MDSSTYLIRLTRMLVLGVVFAAATAAAATAYTGRPPDVQDAANAVALSDIGSPPDVRDAAAALRTKAIPDAFERYAAAHPYGVGVRPILVSRPPDVQDVAAALSSPSLGQSTTGFDWGDYGVGIATGLGLALALISGLLGARQRRHRMQTA